MRGIEKVHKRLLATAAARNLGLLMRKLFGVGKPRALQGLLASLLAQLIARIQALLIVFRLWRWPKSTAC